MKLYSNDVLIGKYIQIIAICNIHVDMFAFHCKSTETDIKFKLIKFYFTIWAAKPQMSL